MASRWTSPEFLGYDGEASQRNDDDEVQCRRREKANSPVQKQYRPESVQRVSHEAAFVAAFEETDVERHDDSPHLDVVPYQENDSPFEAFLSAIFSTLLALLLAWRFLAWNWESGAGEQRRVRSRSHDDSADERESRFASSTDSTSDSSEGHWRWFRRKPGSAVSTHSSPCPESTARKQRKKRRPFDERLAPKRRAYAEQSKNGDQLSPSPSESEDASRTRQLLVQSSLSASPIELEQQGLYSNESSSWRNSIHNNVVVEWPTTAAEDASPDFVSRTIPTCTMDPNFRRPHPEWVRDREPVDEYDNDGSAIRMISGAYSAVASAENNDLDLAGGPIFPKPGIPPSSRTVCGSSSVRRPLVSPPPPPRDPCISLAPGPHFRSYVDMADEESTNFGVCTTACHVNGDEELMEDFLGSDLPAGFEISTCDQTSKAASFLLEGLADTGPFQISSAPDIVRDLDTITEVSETDDLTSLSSNGDPRYQEQDQPRSKPHDYFQHWSRSSTAACASSDKDDSEGYRLAPTVTACSSSSETVNDDDEAYVDRDLFLPSPTAAFHDAPTGFSQARYDWKIDHVSRSSSSSVITVGHEGGDNEVEVDEEGKRTPCLPEDRPLLERWPTVAVDTIITATAAELAFVTASVEGAEQASLAPASPNVLRHESGLRSAVSPTEAGAGGDTPETGPNGVAVRDDNQLCQDFVDEKHRIAGNSAANHAERELESSPTASSSGRTSIATDLPIDESLLPETIEVISSAFDTLSGKNLGIRAPIELSGADFFILGDSESPKILCDLEKNGHSSPLAAPETNGCPERLSLSGVNAEDASGDKTSSPNPISHINKWREDGSEVSSTRREGGGKNKIAAVSELCPDSDQRLAASSTDDYPSSCSSSLPRRERRFQLAYQQYHSQEHAGGDFTHPSSTSSSCSKSEPTKTTLLKQESLSEGDQIQISKQLDAADGDEDDSTAPSSCMDQIDLEKALQRFARYGELYGDAPRSGMEEFGGNKTDNDSFDMSSLDSRVNPMSNSGSSGKLEALIKSTLQSRGSASTSGVGLSSELKRDDLLSSGVAGGTAGAVHALAANGGYTPAAMAKMTEFERREYHLNDGDNHGSYSVTVANTLYERATATGGEDSNKAKATSTSGAVLSHDEKVDGEFLPPSRPRRLSVERGLHDKNRYSSQLSAAATVSNGSSATTVFPANSNEDGICFTKLKSNPATQLARTVAHERELSDKRSRPTSAPLTPLFISSPTSLSSGLGFGIGFSSTYDQTGEPVCVASATSQAIINDPDSSGSQSAFFSSKTQRKILAEASANAVASNPYLALARATTAAASKVAEASSENLLDAGETGTVSLVVSSTVTTTKRDFFSTTKSTPDLLFFPSQADVFDVSGVEVRNQPEMSFRQQRPVEVTPTYNVIPRGTASIFQQRHREMSPGRSGIRSPERKRQNYGQHHPSSTSSGVRSTAATPARDTHEKKALFASAEHLQQLLEDPYYSKPQPKPEPPKRSPPKHEYHIPVAISKPPSPAKQVALLERNISDWNSRPENSLLNQKQQNLLRWRNSMNLAENEELRQALLEDERRAKELAARAAARAIPDDSMESVSFHESKRSSVRATTPVAPDLWEYKAFRDAQQRAEADLDEESKRSRRNKYKAKIDRAKKEYLTTKASASDLYRSIEDFEKKFNVSLENVRLPDPPRGPYLEYLSRSGHLHVLDINDLPPPAYVRPKPRFDREYESIVKKAEESWAAYRRRLQAAAVRQGQDPYARSRAYSTGVLETDVDEESQYHRGQKSIVETDLDQVQRQIEHESRKRTKAPAGPVENAHSRAKSADYLMDQRARTEIEPPENQLQKILGDKDERDLSEHELRFRKSTEKLLVPDWYLNSDYCPGGKVPSPESTHYRPTAYSTERPKSTLSQYGYGRSGMDGHQLTSSYTKSSTPAPPKRQEDQSSRYVSPWVYGGRISGPQGMRSPESPRKRVESPTSHRPAAAKSYDSPRPLAKPATEIKTTYRPEPKKAPEPSSSPYKTTTISSLSHTAHSISKSVTHTIAPGSTRLAQQQHSPQKQDFALPKHFFDKFKDEIEELRKSRSALNNLRDIDDEAFWEEQHLKRLSAQGIPVPVATVRPNLARDEDFAETTTSISFSPASSPESRPTSRPGHAAADTKYAQPVSQSRSQPYSTSKPSPAPRTAQSGSFREAPLNTSTPYSSDILPRKHQPSKETSFEPYRQVSPDQPPRHPPPQPPVQIGRRPSFQDQQPRHMPGGWTVSAVPPDWNVPGQRGSVVIEVAGDGLFDSGSAGNKSQRPPSHLTLEEILDSMFALPVGGKGNLTTINESSSSLLDDVLPPRPRTPTNLDGPGIYAQNQGLMDKCILEPELAAELLKRETLWVKCGYCSRTRELEDARRRGFVSCHHCYTYYCNRICRRANWERHLDICSFARINTLCKQVILKARHDTESQFQMSRVAQRGYQSRGRGSVNFRFFTVNLAKHYVKDQAGGWRSLRIPPGDASEFLHYYTISDLVDAQKDPSLINLCRRYDPRSKFVLSVSIMADIEACPETPPAELETEMETDHRHNQQSSWYQRGVGGLPYTSSGSRPPPLSDTGLSWMTEARRPYVNGVTKDDTYGHHQQPFSRGDQHRHTVAAPQRNRQQRDNGHWPSQHRPALLIGPEDADETEV